MSIMKNFNFIVINDQDCIIVFKFNEDIQRILDLDQNKLS